MFFPEDFEVSVCTKDVGNADHGAGTGTLAQLKAYKGICDDLLPAMRKNSYLHNLLFRFVGNTTLVLHMKADPDQVLGGCTFKFIQTGSHFIVLDVLLMVIAQRADICGQGHGTRIVNLVKHVARQQTVVHKIQSELFIQHHGSSCTCSNDYRQKRNGIPCIPRISNNNGRDFTG